MEGPWKATCVHLFSGVHTLKPFPPPDNFEGTVFKIGDPPDAPIPPGGGGGGGGCEYQIIPDPETCDPNGGGGGGGGGGDGGGGAGDCVEEYICIDIWNENTGSWEEYWCGNATVCG